MAHSATHARVMSAMRRMVPGSQRSWNSRVQRRELAQQTSGQRQPEAEDEPQTLVEWWRQLEADVAAADLAIEREHQARSPRASPRRPSAPHRPRRRTPRLLR